MSRIDKLKFSIESRNFSLELGDLIRAPDRTFVILRIKGGGFWRASRISYAPETKDFIFQVIDNVQTGNLYKGEGNNMTVKLTTEEYGSKWYAVHSLLEVSLENLPRLKELTEYIEANYNRS